ncbi:hypothetical protein RM533_09360 [Croceicoccus sp. F390]|uniref:Uncharacterized protein n=1 Tax=Croceicoccus esteveae TaxID=3075597 RepID=A0ABU2ZJA5_9SPHN|nr:hypothetical protein [Croceicoccus sp. F390]MDT0576394.1 hypothetical protein [Croceicoccus sp. F390]
MADHYTKASFVIEAHVKDIEFLNEIVDLQLSQVPETEWRQQFEKRSARFKNAFPGSDEDPFEAYRALFSDGNYPIADFDIHHMGPTKTDHERIIISGDQIDPETIAKIMQAACPSALPTGFCYAYGCSKLRPDEFGGGFVLITADAIVFRGTQEGLSEALAQIENEDARPLVLATRDLEHGLSFWNDHSGFGRLADATVYTPRQAEKTDPPIAGDEPEWITMPRWPQ